MQLWGLRFTMGVLARLGARASWALLKKKKVGIDAAGNSYYAQLDKNLEGEIIERRIVSYKESDNDPTILPPEWIQWLQKTRDEPPSAETLAVADEARRVMAQRVVAADAAAGMRHAATGR